MKSGYSLVSAVRALVATVAVSSLAVLSSQAVWAQSLGTVTIGTHLDVDTLDPTQNINTHQRWVYRHIFDPLITLSADGKVLPAAAQRWEQIDPLTWFLLEKPPAHCEYFAAGATMLLRLAAAGLVLSLIHI